MMMLISLQTIRLAEGNWEGNHGRKGYASSFVARLAEGNWEGNHGS